VKFVFFLAYKVCIFLNDFSFIWNSQVLTVPKLIEIAAQQIAMEMLRGFGSVRSQPITWWEDSVYGYVVKRFGLERSSAFSIFAQVTLAGIPSTQTLLELLKYIYLFYPKPGII
jgi:hypothetical protein